METKDAYCYSCTDLILVQFFFLKLSISLPASSYHLLETVLEPSLAEMHELEHEQAPAKVLVVEEVVVGVLHV